MNWGHDAVLSIQQAKQFGLLAKMKLVIPYQIPFLAREVGADLTEGVYAATDFWWTLEDKYPLAKMFVEEFEKKYGYKPEWGAENAYMEFALWAEAVENAGTLLSAGRHQVVRGAAQAPVDGRRGALPREDHQLVRPVVIVQGKAPKDMKNKEDFWEVVEVVPGAGADAEARRLRLQPRRLHLTRDRTAQARQPATLPLPRRFLPAMINWANFLSQLFNGLVLGALLALISSGLTIIYGTLGVLNLAHGAMFMLGGYAGYVALPGTPARSSSR